MSTQLQSLSMLVRKHIQLPEQINITSVKMPDTHDGADMAKIESQRELH